MIDPILSQLRETKKQIALDCNNSPDKLLELLNQSFGEIITKSKAKKNITRSLTKAAKSNPQDPVVILFLR